MGGSAIGFVKLEATGLYSQKTVTYMPETKVSSNCDSQVHNMKMYISASLASSLIEGLAIDVA